MDIALLRDVSPGIARCELTYLERKLIDYGRAVKQHEGYRDALRGLGLETVSLPGDADYPDCCFVEDTAVVLDEIAVITRPGAESRRGETAVAAEALAAYRPLATIPAPATLEGGDVLRIGRTLFVGRSTRTNDAGIAALREIVTPHGYTVVAVPVTGCLHLKTAVSAIGERTVLGNPDWADLEPLRVRGRVLMGQGSPLTRVLLEKRGSEVIELDTSEFQKAEAGVTCKSLLFRRGPFASPGGRG
jgi:dimethylargininase